MTTGERALAGSWQLRVCHTPVAEFGPGFSSCRGNDASLPLSEGEESTRMTPVLNAGRILAL